MDTTAHHNPDNCYRKYGEWVSVGFTFGGRKSRNKSEELAIERTVWELEVITMRCCDLSGLRLKVNPGKTRLCPEGQAQWQQGHVTWNVRKFCIRQIRISELCSWPHQHSFPHQGELWHLPPPPQTCTLVFWYPQLWQALRDLCSPFQYILAFPNYV